MTLDEFFNGQEEARHLFEVVQREVNTIGHAELRVTKSQVAFRHRNNFAMVWRPGQYLRGRVAPLVLTILLRYRDDSPRWKEIVEPVPGHFTHHLELHTDADIDGEVVDWLRVAWVSAG